MDNSKNSKKKSSVPLDTLLPKLGDPGKFQIIVFCCLFLNYCPVTFNHIIMAFYGATPPHKCIDSSFEGQNATQFNEKCSAKYYLEDGRNMSIKCSAADDEWTFVRYSARETTIITEWNLVCDRVYLGKLATTIYFLGVMVGGFIFGHLADFFGRKPIMLLSLYCPIALGLGVYFVPSYAGFVSLRFFLGFCMQGLQISTYTLVMELSRKEYRGLAGALFECYWGFGTILVSGIVYFIQDWRYIQLAITLPSCVTFFYYWVIPESPRWLIMSKKIEKAEKIITRIVKVNKLPYPTDIMENIKAHGLAVLSTKYTIAVLFRTPRLRRRTILMYFLWFVTSTGYYGLIFQITALPGDKYLNFFIGACVELLAYFFVVCIIKTFGRRKPLMFYFLIGGISCIVAGCMPFIGKTDTLKKVSTAFAIVGRFGLAGVFSVIVLYSSELFPTVIRNIGLGSCFFWTRVGGLVAPQVILLGDYVHPTFPVLVFGVLSTIGGFLTLLLPETLGRKLPDTIEDAENLRGYKLRTDDEDESTTDISDKGKDNIGYNHGMTMDMSEKNAFVVVFTDETIYMYINH